MSSEETKGDEGAERGLWEEEPLVLVDTKGNNCGYSIPLENSPDGLDFVVCQKAGSEGDFPLTGVPLTGRQVQPEDTAAGALLLDVMDSFKMAQSEVSDVLHKVVCTPGPCDGSLQSLRGMTDQEWEVLQVPRPLVKTIQDRINRASRDTSRGGQTIQRLRSKLMQREKQSTKMRQTDALEMTEDRQGNKRLDSDTEPDGDGSAVGAKERTSWQGKGGGEELVMTFDPPGSPDAATQRSPVVIRLPIPTTLEEKEEAGRELNRGLEKLQDAWRKPEGVHATEKESSMSERAPFPDAGVLHSLMEKHESKLAARDKVVQSLKDALAAAQGAQEKALKDEVDKVNRKNIANVSKMQEAYKKKVISLEKKCESVAAQKDKEIQRLKAQLQQQDVTQQKDYQELKRQAEALKDDKKRLEQTIKAKSTSIAQKDQEINNLKAAMQKQDAACRQQMKQHEDRLKSELAEEKASIQAACSASQVALKDEIRSLHAEIELLKANDFDTLEASLLWLEGGKASSADELTTFCRSLHDRLVDVTATSTKLQGLIAKANDAAAKRREAELQALLRGHNAEVEALHSKHKAATDEAVEAAKAEAKDCMICMAAPKTTYFTACRHLSVCPSCRDKLLNGPPNRRKCPACRVAVSQWREVYNT